ncbi:MAG: NAD/NADP octopine/nopaline dehydrogenase family protein [Spirochaetes bacterium]|nr:NAD/NADP octopine/nopaline dehydrogenase family protein [Spirochaetota bacterium]
MSGKRRDDERLTVLLRGVRAKGTEARWCVVGAGNGGLAMAGHLGILGYPVTLYNRTADRLHGVRWHGGIKVDGAVSGFGPVQLATSDMGEAVRSADVVMVVTPATAHRSLAALMAPHLRDGQLVVLNPGRTGGALELRKVFADGGVTAAVVVAETQTFLYASRALSPWEAHIFRIKNANPLATLPSYWIPEALGILNGPFPQFVAGSNVLTTSLENIGAVFHPALTILNAGWIEATHGDFDYYLQGITPAVAKVLERVDAERLRVASALGIRSMSAREWLYLSYDSPGRDLCEAIRNTESYRGIRAPQSIAHRYISEDVPMSLVPIASLGAMLGVPTPVTDMIIDLGSMLHGTDYRAAGRTVESLGLAGLTLRQIRQMVGGVAPVPRRKERRHG